MRSQLPEWVSYKGGVFVEEALIKFGACFLALMSLVLIVSSFYFIIMYSKEK